MYEVPGVVHILGYERVLPPTVSFFFWVGGRAKKNSRHRSYARTHFVARGIMVIIVYPRRGYKVGFS